MQHLEVNITDMYVLMIDICFILLFTFYLLGGTPRRAQKLFLSLRSEVTLSGMQGIMYMPEI